MRRHSRFFVAYEGSDVSNQSTYTVENLIYLMQLLRDPETGCPWDVKQTPETIVRYTLEEVHEVVDAIEKGDWSAIQEELGDLLFQVAFYCQMADEQDRFNFNDVVHQIVKKMIRRHPHVFPSGQLEQHRSKPVISEQAVRQQWEQIKATEHAEKYHDTSPYPLAERFAQIPKGLGALAYAQKVQKGAALHGLDWPDVGGALARLREEMAEFESEINVEWSHKEDGAPEDGSVYDEARSAIAAELGDVLFTCVNVARHLQIDAEHCLRQSTRTFCRRAESVEKQWQAAPPGVPMGQADGEALNDFWQVAKVEIE
jgi:nucleoside triphosphate diphosphatase